MPDLPPGACDTHTHLFPPAAVAPPTIEVAYELPQADLAAHLAMLAATGMTRAVLVQAGVYGTDPAVLLDALARAPRQLRGVASVAGDADRATLAALYSGGVRGLRFTEVRDPVTGGRYRGTVGLGALDALAPAMRCLGLHAQLWSPLGVTLANLDRLRSSGIPLVLDHMGLFDLHAGTDGADFRALIGLLGEGWLWVKLSICRVSPTADQDRIRPFHDALVAAAPDRMLWASDWPFVRLADPPEPRRLLERFIRWVPDRDVQAMILAHNPARLYDFQRAETYA